ncbi:MAG: hypothetical protein J6Y68_02240 [Clostridia bacterium]|nr:hypothetical protein [Clostridia bacterium]MBP5593506.1 hypothetical protein [Clostridia bacterium]
MDALELKLCDIQGRLFELFLSTDYDAENLVKAFMNSELAKNLDSEYNRMQWAGEEYLLEELIATCKDKLTIKKESVSKEVLFWMGYVYRYWHFYTKEESAKIYKQASFETMNVNYLMFHTMDVEVAIDDLKEIYKQKK